MVRKSSHFASGRFLSLVLALSTGPACSDNDGASGVRDAAATGGRAGTGGTGAVSTGGLAGTPGTGGAGGMRSDANACSCGDGMLTWDCYCSVFNCNATLTLYQPLNTTSGMAGLEEFANCNLTIVYIKEGPGPWVRHAFDLATGRLVGDETGGDVTVPCPFGSDGFGHSKFGAGTLDPGPSCVRSECLGTLSPGRPACGSEGHDSGAGGNGGASGSGDAGDGDDAGDTGGTSRDGGDLDMAEPSYCAPCVDDAAATTFTCPAQRPTSEADLRAFCGELLRPGRASVSVSIGACAISSGLPLPGCRPTTAEASIDVLSATFFRVGFDCHYSRATGALVGQTMTADSPHYCGDRAYVAQTSSVTNPWCNAGGPAMMSLTCTGPAVDGGVDASSNSVLNRED